MATTPGAVRDARRPSIALFLATLMLAAGFASWWTHDATRHDIAPEVAVEGGAVVGAVPGRVTVLATGPECAVHMSTPAGRATPRPFTLEIVNTGAAPDVTGLVNGETAVRQGRDLRVDVDPGRGWPRDISSRLPEPVAGGNWTFIAMGDPQGHDWNVEAAGELADAMGARFILLLGDVVASGEQAQYDSLTRAMGNVSVPVFAVPGNHDTTNLGSARFLQAFGSFEGRFDFGGVRFVLLDTSSQTFGVQGASYLSGAAAGRPAGERLVVATHTSPLDPRPHGSDPYLDPGGSARLMAAVESAGADLLLAGHVHMYCSTATTGGVPLVVTGGGGGVLIASEGPWNFHHLLRVDVSPGGIDWTATRLSDRYPAGGSSGPSVTVEGRQGRRAVLTIGALRGMAVVNGSWSFQDRLGNWEGVEAYVGVPVATMLDLVGGMGAPDRLRVAARDGYTQEFSFDNVHPGDVTWAAQGDMVLAISRDGAIPPAWEDGPRLILTPPDGRYSNADAEATTAPSMRSDPFSAGTRWVREVASIEVLAG
jgi:predicted phosphodiesterase